MEDYEEFIRKQVDALTERHPDRSHFTHPMDPKLREFITDRPTAYLNCDTCPYCNQCWFTNSPYCPATGGYKEVLE